MIDELGRWEKFLKGNEQSLADIFLCYHDDLFRYGLKLTRREEMVKDCIQDLFLKLWKNRSNIQVVREVKPYLFRSLRNHLIDSLELQKQSIFQNISTENIDEFDVRYSYDDFLKEGSDEETRERVIEVLNKLTPRQREAIFLRFFEKLDFETIAKVMDMNVQSVRNTLHRSLEAMRKASSLIVFMLVCNPV